MIGLGVKVEISGARLATLNPLRKLAFLAALVVMGCSGKPGGASAQPTAPISKPQAGAARWDGEAMLLPEHSPFVVVARLSEVLDAGERLREWVVAEPAMLGDDGEEAAQSITYGWQAATAYLGVDPFEPSAWAERGVDPTRPIHAALYPISQDGEKLIHAVDSTLRQTLGLPPGAPIGPSLRTLSSSRDGLPEGTNSEMLRRVDTLDPLGGLRVVVPLTSREEFLTTTQAFAQGLGFIPFPADVAGESLPDDIDIAMWSPSGEVPAIAVRAGEKNAVLDVVFPVFVGGAPSSDDVGRDPNRVWSELRRVLRTVKPGRPDAPRPVNAPSLAAAFDQSAMASFAKLRGYRATLEGLRTVGANRRDDLLLRGLTSTVSEAEIWAVASDELTGTTYELEVGSATGDLIGRVSMTLFGTHDLEAIVGSPAMPSLGVQNRSAAIGVTLDALRAKTWRSWFSSDTPAEMRAVDFDSADGARILVPGIRLLAVAGSNIGDPAGLATFARAVSEVLSELKGVRRVELVGLSSSVTDFQRNPRLLAAFVLDESDAVATAELIRHEMRRVLRDLIDAPESLKKPELMKVGVTGQSDVPGFGPLFHHVSVEGQPVALFGIGLEPDAFEAELATLRRQTHKGSVLQGRLEPVALLTWARLDDPDRFKPLDLDILAQRLGPLTLDYETLSLEDAEAVTLGFRLEAPPEL